MAIPFRPPTADRLSGVDDPSVDYSGQSIVEIEGVVSGAGGGGWSGYRQSPEFSYDVHAFDLAAWRYPDQPLKVKDLLILRPVPPLGESGKLIFEEIPPYSIQRFRALICKDGTRAVVEQILPVDVPDPALVLFAEQLRLPVAKTTERFGDFLLDVRVELFATQVEWNRKTVQLLLPKDEDGDISRDALRTAEILWDNQRRWKREVNRCAAGMWLPVANWPKDERLFIRVLWMLVKPAVWLVARLVFWWRLNLTSISVGREGHFAFWHTDGGLYSGHSIEVRGNLEKGCIEAGIHG